MTAAPGASPSPLVLVVDDDSEVRDFVCEILREAGFGTATATDGDEVPEQARRVAPRLIILDVMMPRMDGYTALARLRGHPATRDIPVIVLTGQTEPVYRTLSAGVGAVAHLTKPFVPEQLTSMVRRAITEASA
jgi:CheY-like chemotaxis protein